MIGLALALGWEPGAVKALTLPELEVVSEHLKARRRAQARELARARAGRR